MTKQETLEIVQAINTSQPGNKMVDLAFKFVSAASLALLLWTLTSVNMMQLDIVELSSNAVYTRMSLEKLEDFTDQPRFTRENFDEAIKQHMQEINQNTKAIEDHEDRLDKLDLQIQQLQLSQK